MAKKPKRAVANLNREGNKLELILTCGHVETRRVKRRYIPGIAETREDPDPTWAYCSQCLGDFHVKPFEAGELFQTLRSCHNVVEKYFGEEKTCLYLSIIIRGAELSDDDRRRFGELLDRLIEAGLVLGRLGPLMFLPLLPGEQGERSSILAYIFCTKSREEMNALFSNGDFFVEEGGLGPELWPMLTDLEVS